MNELKQIRNRGCIPDLHHEGYFRRPLEVSPVCAGSENYPEWHKNMSPWSRLANHHTMASARRFTHYIMEKAPRDNLDFTLNSTFNPYEDAFGDKVDAILQPETLGMNTWRRLRNVLLIEPAKIIDTGHPLVVGGIQQRRDPNNVKLMNSGPHSPQTNAGYIRNGQGGNIFYY